MNEYRKPLPRPSALSQPWWEAAHDGRLVVQTCGVCGAAQHPPRPLCLTCWSDDLAWAPASGEATIYSFTVAHRSTTRGFREDGHYVVAIVELAEGARMTTNIIGCAPDEVRIGQRVRAVFDPVTETVTLPKFTPVAA